MEIPGSEMYRPPSEPYVSNAPPASTELLATRHFDYIVSPLELGFDLHGNMSDTSVSLGEYARQLRAQKQKDSLPNSVEHPK
jgi:hypothetical protein